MMEIRQKDKPALILIGHERTGVGEEQTRGINVFISRGCKGICFINVHFDMPEIFSN